MWHHAAVTYGQSHLRLYLDGTLDAEISLDEPPRSDSIQHAGLGTAFNSTGVAAGFFQGTLDEALIWNYARSSQQIRQSRNQPIASAPGLAGRWALDEGSGTTIHDSAGTNNGTAINGPLWVAGYGFLQDGIAPAAPQHLTAGAGSGQSAGTITLTWDANAEPDLAGYNLYRSTTSPVSTGGAPVNGDSLLRSSVFTDTGLLGGATYYYAVMAVDNSDNSSAPSAEASATTPVLPTSTPTGTPDANAAVLVGAGDIASCTSTGDEATASLLDNIAGTIFTTGDNVYDNGTAAEFASCYDPSWGRHKARIGPRQPRLWELDIRPLRLFWVLRGSRGDRGRRLLQL